MPHLEWNLCRRRPSNISPHKDVSSSTVSESRILYDGQSFHSPTNAALLLENFKEEAESLDADHLEATPLKESSASKKRLSIDSHEILEASLGTDSVRYSLKACKHENDPLSNSGDTTYTFFASLLDSSIQGSNYVRHVTFSLSLSFIWVWTICWKKMYILCLIHTRFYVRIDVYPGLDIKIWEFLS